VDRAGFSKFIEWLDAGIPSNGQAYVDMHRRLRAYFARKGCAVPDDLADDVLSRVARRLEEEGSITGVTPAHYCYITARFVLLEYLRTPGRAPLPHDLRQPPPRDDDSAERDLVRLEECLNGLDPRDRELILAYYSGPRAGRVAARRDLAARLGLSANALTIRASRLRERLRKISGPFAS
jgi:RNA polymerase sigma factor (sigma-70 family)